MCPGVGTEGRPRCFAHLFVVLSSGGTHSTLLSVPALQKWQLGFFFGLFVSFGPEFASTAHARSYF